VRKSEVIPIHISPRAVWVLVLVLALFVVFSAMFVFAGHGPAAAAVRPLVRSACPVTTPPRTVTPNFSQVVGTGPVYAMATSFTFPTMLFAYPPPKRSQFYGSKWGGQVLKLLGSPDYRGGLLLRGHQLGGPNAVRFGTLSIPFTNLRLPRAYNDPAVGGWAGWGTYIRLRRSGCYRLQIIGASFSETIVFRAKIVKNPPAVP
jgi:hypothetical protein